MLDAAGGERRERRPVCIEICMVPFIQRGVTRARRSDPRCDITPTDIVCVIHSHLSVIAITPLLQNKLVHPVFGSCEHIVCRTFKASLSNDDTDILK